MKTKKYYLWIVCAEIISVFLNSCSYNESVTHRSQLSDLVKTGTISVMTQNKLIYRLTNYSLKDSSILGEGILEDNEQQIHFKGELQFSDISYVQMKKESIWHGIKIIIPVYIFSSLALKSFGGINGFALEPVISYRGPAGKGGSCPFIYSWNGERYVLESEAFGVALGKGLEMNTLSVLRTLKPEEGKIKIRITNERPETHFFNSVRLLAVETDVHENVVADNDGRLWSLKNPVPSSFAVDHSKRNVTERLKNNDGDYYESDLSQVSFGGNCEDVVELHFPNSTHSREGSIVFDAINTKFSLSVFNYLFDFLGDQSIEFTDAIDNDPEMISILKQWLYDASLKVSVWNGIDWVYAGMVYPEANEVPFSRLMRINASMSSFDTLKVRLTSLADVWKLDAVTVDWGERKPLKTQEVKLLSAVHSNGKDVSKELGSADDHYVVNLPPDEISLTFDDVKANSGKNIVYALDARGYLYEWYEYSNSSSRSFPVVPSSQKITYLKSLLRHKDLFLPVIYEEWKKEKAVAGN